LSNKKDWLYFAFCQVMFCFDKMEQGFSNCLFTHFSKTKLIKQVLKIVFYLIVSFLLECYHLEEHIFILRFIQ